MKNEVAKNQTGEIVTIFDITEEIKLGREKTYFSAQKWFCPVCGIEMSIKFGHKGEISGGRETHFFHREGAGLFNHEPESVEHRKTKNLFIELLKNDLSIKKASGDVYDYVEPRMEEVLCGGNSKADVYFSVTSNDGEVREYAIEVQYSPIDPVSFEKRHNEYRKHNIIDLWVMSSLEFIPEAPKQGSRGLRIRPKAVIEKMFEFFDSVQFIDLEKNAFYDLFLTPSIEARTPLYPKTRGRENYMYSSPNTPTSECFKTSEVMYLDVLGQTDLENHLEELGYVVNIEKLALTNTPLDSIVYDKHRGVMVSFERLKKISKELLTAHSNRTTGAIISKAVPSADLANYGILSFIFGLKALGILLNDIFFDLFDEGKKEWSISGDKFNRYFLTQGGYEMMNISFYRSLNLIIDKILYIRRTNKDWNRGHEKKLRGYLFFMKGYINSERYFADKQPSETLFSECIECVSDGSKQEKVITKTDEHVFESMQSLLSEYCPSQKRNFSFLDHNGLPYIFNKLLGKKYWFSLAYAFARHYYAEDNLLKHLSRLDFLEGKE